MTGKEAENSQEVRRSAATSERLQRFLKLATTLVGVVASLLGTLLKETGGVNGQILLIATAAVGAVVAFFAELILTSRRHDPKKALRNRVKDAYLRALDSSALSRPPLEGKNA